MRYLFPNLQKKYSKIGLKTRLVWLFTISAFLSIAAIGAVSLFQTNRVINAMIRQNTSRASQLVNISVGMILDEAMSVMNISSDYFTHEFISSDEAHLYQSSKNVGSIFAYLRRFEKLNSNIVDITIISKNGNCISDRNGFFRLENGFETYEITKTVEREPRNTHVLRDPEKLCKTAANQDVVSLAKAIMKVGTNDVYGLIRIDIDRKVLSDLLESTKHDSTEFATIIDRNGQEVFIETPEYQTISNEIKNELKENLSNSGEFVTDIYGQQHLVIFNHLENTDWIMVQTILSKTLREPVITTTLLIIFTLLISMAMVLLINNTLSKQLVQPITKLEEMMEKVEAGDLKIQVHYNGNDEISKLYESFDHLLQKLNKTLETLVHEQEGKERSELNALQAQINPHFLYNSLESVIWVAEMNKMEDVIELTIALSNFYKIVLSKGLEMITIEREVELATNYLRIMKMRYRDILEFSIHVDPEIYICRIPKLTLQPIIENAIYHGIKNTGHQGKVEIEIAPISDSLIRICIHDDGIGMSPEALSQLEASLFSKDQFLTKYYGLTNVNRRIKLYYGKEYRIHIMSEQSAGTTVEIIVPKILTQDMGKRV